MGIIQKVTEASELMNETLKIAKKITQQGPNAVLALKKLVRNGYQMDINKAYDKESEEFSKLFESDGPEGMTAFLEKRKPNWK
jgi:enoyl-CoA hydratase